ncbi:citrate lyase ligase C-terminal domain protein [Candidatus Phytoplasma oryzae]|uniref:Citrate lyase ligase C-terminal domain protein n=1 Tax=Candidatus Phytoplasma oryzae TaxID=203274 RepID=A0A139JQM7_9MOLU|nr:GNAT family N-acetyltransferase [Candidatus Phytoplasma oryzae]KXT29273.1 citrate lyase ligase C-terminal domain protein [Candidatus Phytoplasma oryzae]RAM57856.1 hypothetical protein DH96_00830 [Candidatus Phytoplasma oryzae]
MEFFDFQKPKIISAEDKVILKEIKTLLKEENLKKDLIEEYACIFTNKNSMIGFIGRYANNLRCLVIKKKYRQYNIANILIDFMLKRIYQQNFREIFVFTKPINFDIFMNLGFKLIFNNKKFGFFTNRYDLFQEYLNYLSSQKIEYQNLKIHQDNSVIIMNANPFTKGHEFLIQKAIQKSNFVYVIIVKEEASLFSYAQRLYMVKSATCSLKNVKIIEGSNYLVSKNVFPSYFLKSKKAASLEQMYLDASIFSNFIAPRLDIKKRFVGEEPFSKVTHLYNMTMKKILFKKKIELIIVSRMMFKNKFISATQVRKFFIEGNFKEIKNLVPYTTFEFLKKLDYKKYQNQINLLKLVDKNF